MRPPCYNRAAFTDPNAGWRDVGMRDAFVRFLDHRGERRPARYIDPIGCKPALRYRWPWFTDRCTLHDKADIGPNQTYPQFHGWDCTGCKWRPA